MNTTPTAKDDLIAVCHGMSQQDMIATYHAEYYDKTRPYIRQAFDAPGVEEHEVTDRVYRNIK